MNIPNEDFLQLNSNFIKSVVSHYCNNENFNKTYDVVDFFSGCGGMSLGFNLVGKETNFFNHIAAFDNDKYAIDTFKKNISQNAHQVDLTEIKIEEIRNKINLNRNDKNGLIFIGCAPCQGFSSHKKKDKRVDPRNSLVGLFGEFVSAFLPDLVIMENVPDLLNAKHIRRFKVFQDALRDSGYKLAIDVVNMARFGVPQQRHRTIVIASREYYPTIPNGFIEQENYRTVYNAISHLDKLNSGQQSSIDAMHKTSNHRNETIEIFKSIPKNGGSRPIGVGPKCLDKVKGFSDVYGRLTWEKPSVTITARCRTPSCGRFLHPEDDRGLSIREAALLQGFPHNFIVEGPFDDKFKQIGNAVPPIFSVCLAAFVISMIDGMNRSNDEYESFYNIGEIGSFSGMIGRV